MDDVSGAKQMSDFDKWLEGKGDRSKAYKAGADEAWNHQQKKIDAIIQCVKDNTADYELDNKIQELLK